MAAATRVYDLPPAFYFDHRFRDLPAGEVVKEAKRYVRVELTREEYDEILSDARYYASEMIPAGMGFEGFGLAASARATVKRLLAQPWEV